MDTAKLRELAALEPADFAYHADAIRRNAAEAAETIERLQGLTTDLDLLAKKRLTLIKEAQQERDEARAEVERLKAEVEELDNIRLAQS